MFSEQTGSRTINHVADDKERFVGNVSKSVLQLLRGEFRNLSRGLCVGDRGRVRADCFGGGRRWVLNYEAVDRQSRSCCIIADRLHSGLSSLQFCCEVIYHLRIAGSSELAGAYLLGAGWRPPGLAGAGPPYSAALVFWVAES
ncbi:hypothetical protein, partial [Mycolicibacterium thermoresistibile]|uniref:hypothetical protein n=1 Tax=Mycolicibacterium thermoresistibile TaxID=1797 RepID=UPI001A7ED2AC